MAKEFEIVFREKKRKRKKLRAVWTLHLPYVHSQFYLKGVDMFILPADKKATASVSWVDKKGNPALIDGVPVWATSDNTITDLQVAADGLSAVLLGGLVGNCQISVTADADLGAGTKAVVALLDVQVVAGEAAVGVITPGALEAQ